jgi:hypothetical protein
MKRQLQWFSLALGFMLAAAIVFVQIFQFQQTTTSKKEAKTEQHDSKKAKEELRVSLPSFSLPSQVHVSVNLDAYCLFEITFEENEQKEMDVLSPLLPEKFLTTLFRVIISPNAP